MKTVIHAQTEPFQFIGFEYEETEVLSDERIQIAIEDFRRIAGAIKTPVSAGLTAKELDFIIEKMCLGTTVEGGTELWSKVTQAQKDQINCLKRALKRIEAKNK